MKEESQSCSVRGLWSHSSQGLWARKNCHPQLSKNNIPKCPGIDYLDAKEGVNMIKSQPVLWHAETGSCNGEHSSWAALDLQHNPVTGKKCLLSTAFHRHPTKFQVIPDDGSVSYTATRCTSLHMDRCSSPDCKSRWKQTERQNTEKLAPSEKSCTALALHAQAHPWFLQPWPLPRRNFQKSVSWVCSGLTLLISKRFTAG